MAGTRRSARQSTATAPKYTEDSESEFEGKAPKRNGKKPTRRKRVREDDDGEEDDESPPPKKPTGSRSRPTKPAASPQPAKEAATKPAAAPMPTPSSTNRDADGNQEVYWLFKAEPMPRYENGVNVAFSIDDLQKCTKPEPWTGVRNPQARNNMQLMRTGDLGFFYHSNAKPSGVVGMLRVVEEAKVDETAFDEKDPYYDAKSKREEPKWYCVGVEFVKKFEKVVDLGTIKSHAAKGGELEGMQLVTNGRLSVCRVRREEWEFILGLAEGKEEGKEKAGGGGDEEATTAVAEEGAKNDKTDG